MSIITRPSSIANFLLLALLALVLAGCEEIAGDSYGQPPPPLPPAHSHTIRFWRDFSSSIDETALAQIVDELTDGIMLHKEKIVGIEVVRFANGTDSIWSEMPARFIWGPAPEIPEFKPDLENAPPEAKLFKEAMKEHMDGERRRYEENKALILTRYKAHVDEQLEKFKDYLLQRPTVNAPCTQFRSLAERMRKEDLPYNLTITDGWADCHGEADGAVSSVELHGKHVIIQLTRHMDSHVNDGEVPQREAFLRKLFTTAEIVPASMPNQAIALVFR